MRAIIPLAALGLLLCTGCAGLGEYAKGRGSDFLDCFHVHAGYGLGADVQARATQFITLGGGAVWGHQWVKRGREPATSNRFAHLGPPATTGFGALVMVFYAAPSILLDAASGPLGPENFGVGLRKALERVMAGPALAVADMSTHESPSSDPAELIVGKSANVSVLGISWPREDGSWILPWSERAAEWREQVFGSARPIDIFDLEVGGSALASFRFGFSPGQFADLVLGFLGLDIAGDDEAPETEATGPGRSAQPPAK